MHAYQNGSASDLVNGLGNLWVFWLYPYLYLPKPPPLVRGTGNPSENLGVNKGSAGLIPLHPCALSVQTLINT